MDPKTHNGENAGKATTTPKTSTSTSPDRGAGAHGEPGTDPAANDGPKWPGGGKKGESETKRT